MANSRILANIAAGYGIALQVLLVLLLIVLHPSPQLQADEAARDEPKITERSRQHWSFRPLSHPAPPNLADTDWPRNPIDQFVLQRLREASLAPTTPADRRTLIRRLAFDLTGLPPTPGEVNRFLKDDRPDAYERLVDRLLASDAYGERWAQHWLDLARFAETDGFELDKVRKDAWRYRDWVINALNEDMPYGEFVRQQLAGDLLYPGDPDAAIATGFALAGPDMTDINLVAERRHMVLNDITGTVGSVFLGLQMGCAECHDHKYDPVSQADFYRLRAFFEPALHFGANAYEATEANADKSRPKAPEGRVLYEHADAQPPNCYVWLRGDFRSRGPQVQPAFPGIAVPASQSPYPSEPTRSSLASWLADPGNYLASRVIVNRLWQHHFGHGIVRSPSDFGTMGESPTHPELLDWLADELYRRGGSLKQMHRLMVTSATYRQSSRLASESEEGQAQWARGADRDPENRMLWRANRRRLEGEAIRDAMLVAADRLSDRKAGRGVMPPLPQELVTTLLANQWKVSKNEEDHRRRSIYLFVRRNLRYPLFEVFDRPDSNASCPRRARSTIATQALVLLNSEFSSTQARHLAEHVVNQADQNMASRIELIYRRTLSRPPSQAELERALAFVSERVEQSRQEDGSPQFVMAAERIDGVDRHELSALTYLGLATFNLNEFVYID